MRDFIIKNIFLPILISIISSIIIGILSCLYNFNIKNNFKKTLQNLIEHLFALNNHITWGNEDKKELYYLCAMQKIDVILTNLNILRSYIKPLNFVFHNKNNIIKQIDSIEKKLFNIMEFVVCDNPEKEITSRLNSIAKELQIGEDNLLIRQSYYILYLLDNRNKKSLKKACIADDDDDREAIRKYICNINK